MHVIMRTLGSRTSAEDTNDLEVWARGLEGCPPVTHTTLARCSHPSHGTEPATWFYVEADADEGVARLRCLPGGHAKDVQDSAERWTYPGVWSCLGCHQSIAEVVYGIHEVDDKAQWMALTARCVECGDVAGLTDMFLGEIPVGELISAL